MADAGPVLPDGIPSREECDALRRSSAFGRMAAFSEAFLTRNRSALAPYVARWGAENPLHSWSRQWEYPWIVGKVADLAAARPGRRIRVLDAGSGATFLPFYISACFEQATVDCCDQDQALTDMFRAINQNMDADIDFSVADLRELPYEDRSFDLVCCVAVLEHTKDHRRILAELERVLEPGGAARDHLRHLSGRDPRHARAGPAGPVGGFRRPLRRVIPAGAVRDAEAVGPWNPHHPRRGSEPSAVERAGGAPSAEGVSLEPAAGGVAAAADGVLSEHSLRRAVRQLGADPMTRKKRTPCFWQELRGRSTVRAGSVYVAAAFVTLQLGEIVLPAFDAPLWVLDVRWRKIVEGIQGM